MANLTRIRRLVRRSVANAGRRDSVVRPAGPSRMPDRSERSEPLPLSLDQLRLWKYDRSLPQSLALHEPVILRLSGPLRVPALRSALRRIVMRHELLRTTFPVTDSGPVQVIGCGQPRVTLIDIRGLPREIRGREASRLIAAEETRPFDLVRGPVLRLTLVSLEDTEHVLLVNIHHVATDVWSLGILGRELGSLYEAHHAGTPDPLPEVAVQFADYALWERRRLTGDRRAALVRYWLDELRGARSLDLPFDHPRPSVSKRVKQIRWRVLDDSSNRALRELSNAEGVTLFVTLLALFHTLLHHWTGQKDITVVTPAADRSQPWLADTIGFLVRTFWLRQKLDDDPTFRSLMARARRTVLGALDHQDAPFEQVLDEFQPDRPDEPNPLLQIGMTVLNVPPVAIRLPGLSLAAGDHFVGGQPGPDHRYHRVINDSDLELHLQDDGFSLRWGFTFDPELFDPATIAGLDERFVRLVRQVTADPSLRLSQLRSSDRP